MKDKKELKLFDKIFNIIKEFFLIIFYIFVYAFIGLKACTYDLFVFLYNSISWKLDKAYRRTKDVISKDVTYEPISKKQKTYNYSEKTLAKLNKEYQELLRDLETSGATRSKDINVYYFKVRDKNGKIITGTVNGQSKLDVNAFLLNEGYTVYSIKTSSLINFFLKDADVLGGNMSNKELIFFLTQLSTYIKAGITLNDAIKILGKQMGTKTSKGRAFQAISYELVLGSSFSHALEKQGKMFPALLINMIKAAEASGTLTETLDDMANYYTEIDETKKQMKSAMRYPIIISIFALVVIVFILTFIIPKFVDIYEQNNIPVEGLTLAVINVGNFLVNNYMTIIGVLLISIILFVIAFKKLKAFRKTVQTILMNLPVIKNIIIYNELAVLTKTFSSLLHNNVFITDSIDILSNITKNEVYKEILFRTINNIVKGEKISEAFKDQWAVPEVAYYMIVTGESTGELANMMGKVSSYYQGLHRNTVDTLKAFIEPIMIAVLALVVGLIICAVVIPMFGMYNNLGL